MSGHPAGPCSCREATICGVRAVILENDSISAAVLPGKGGDIYSLVAKPQGIDVLWRSPWGLRPLPAGASAGVSECEWLDRYEGGWQVLFPNGGDACEHRGAHHGFHGEASSSEWEYRIRGEGPSTAEVELFLCLRRSPFRISRTLSLERGASVLRITETIRNCGEEPLHYMWGQHPAFGRPFIDGCRIQVPARAFLAHETEISPNCRLGAGASGPWPRLRGKSGEFVDLSVVPPSDQRVTEFGYVSDLEDGWYALISERLNLAFGLAWPREVFPYLWFWQELRGSFGYPWYGRCSVMAIEPFNSIPGAGLARAVAAGSAPVLEAGAEVTANFAAVLFPPREVRRIALDGSVEAAPTKGNA